MATPVGTGDVATAARQVARQVADGAFRDDDFDIDDGFEHDGPGIAHRFDHRLAAGNGEGHFLAVDGMRLAVINGDLDVLDFVAGDHAALQPLADTLLDRGHEDAGNHPALHRIDELEALAPALRLDAQMHLAELPGAARLLLVAIHRLGMAGDGFAVGNARRLGVDLQLVLAGHLGQFGLEVDFAETADDRLVAGRMAFDDKGRIFHGQLAENVKQALLIALLLRLDRQAGHRLGKFERHQVNVVLVVRIVQHAVELDFIDLGDGTDVARQQLIDLHRVLALQLVEMGHLDRPLAVADEELHVLLHCALMHAENADLAHIGVGNDLEDMGQHMLSGIRHGLEGLRVAPRLALVEGRRVAFGRVRCQRGQHMQQFLDAGPGPGRGEQDGNQVAFAQRLLERCV